MRHRRGFKHIRVVFTGDHLTRYGGVFLLHRFFRRLGLRRTFPGKRALCATQQHLWTDSKSDIFHAGFRLNSEPDQRVLGTELAGDSAGADRADARAALLWLRRTALASRHCHRLRGHACRACGHCLEYGGPQRRRLRAGYRREPVKRTVCVGRTSEREEQAITDALANCG